jgi:hypothetical protein
MTVEQYERYEITHVPEGLQISHWQALPSLGIGVIALVLLAACFLTDPYQGHNRFWAGLGVVVLALVALFGVKVESWILSDCAIRYKSGLWNKERLLELSPGMSLTARAEFVPCDSDGIEPAFPHVMHLVSPGGIELGDGFRFRERATVDRFLQTLRRAAPIETTAVRSEAENPHEPDRASARASDRRAD